MAIDKNIMSWDDVLEDDGREFVVLPEGDYDFTVTAYERGSFPGGAKIPACPKATVTLDIDNDQGIATARVDLLLYRTLEWKIASFFRAIGQKKLGEKVSMNWGKVIGERGRAHFRPRSYTKNGEERQVNDVVRFYDREQSEGFTAADNEKLPWEDDKF